MTQSNQRNAIELFMWAWQQHFQCSVESSAESIFNSLDNRLEPRCFLIGFLTKEREDRHPICIEPEDDCEYKPKFFSEVLSLAEHFEAIDDDLQIFHTHTIAQKNQELRIRGRALVAAVEKVLNRFGEHKSQIAFCSFPTLVEDYLVCVVLQLNKAAFASHYSLLNDKLDGRYHVATSLLDATIIEFLDACAKSLREPDAGQDLDVLNLSRNNYLRAAGRKLMATPALRTSRDYAYSLFSDFCDIASLRYERKEGIGELILAERYHPNVQVDVAFKNPIALRRHRGVRKILEMSRGGLCLLSTPTAVYGLGRQVGNYDAHNENLFRVDFIGQHKWELLHDNQSMMHVEFGEPRLPAKPINEQKFKSDIRRLFSEIKRESLDQLWGLAITAANQKHGTLLVISNSAASESERLAVQSMPIEPVLLTEQDIPMLTAIDGAILISPECVCYAIGVILDGLASEKGSSARGSRFNSAIRYVETSKKQFGYQCLAIVVSEDGTIDLIPNLMPLLKRSALEEALNNFRKIGEVQEINVKDFNRTMDWFSNHRFYLSSEVCQEVNDLRKSIESRWPNAIRIMRSDLSPNPEMNDSYFMD